MFIPQVNLSKSKKDKIKGLTFPIELSSDLAYLCGVIAGDGSIYTRSSKHDYIIKCVGNPKDEKEYYNKILSPLFRSLFKIKIKVKLQDQGSTYGFVIYSKGLYGFFTKIIGLPSGKKYITLIIPNLFKKHKELCNSFIQGVADTDFCLSFKKKYSSVPYYPVISGCSKSKRFMKEISFELKKQGFQIAEIYDYKVKDIRFKKGYSIINRIDLNGVNNYKLWLNQIGFRHPKHLKKIKKYSGEWTFKDMQMHIPI